MVRLTLHNLGHVLFHVAFKIRLVSNAKSIMLSVGLVGRASTSGRRAMVQGCGIGGGYPRLVWGMTEGTY